MQNQEQTQRPESLVEKVKMTTQAILFFARIFAIPMQFLMHGLPGERYLGFSGIFAGLLILFFPLFFPHYSPLPIYLLLFIYLAKCVVLRTISLYRWWIKYPLGGHSRDPGRPLLGIVLRKCSAEFVAWCEPLMIFVFASVIYPYERPLGCYLFAAAVGLFTWLSAHTVYERNRLLDQHDAIIEARHRAERFREFQNR